MVVYIRVFWPEKFIGDVIFTILSCFMGLTTLATPIWASRYGENFEFWKQINSGMIGIYITVFWPKKLIGDVILIIHACLRVVLLPWPCPFRLRDVGKNFEFWKQKIEAWWVSILWYFDPRNSSVMLFRRSGVVLGGKLPWPRPFGHRDMGQNFEFWKHKLVAWWMSILRYFDLRNSLVMLFWQFGVV